MTRTLSRGPLALACALLVPLAAAARAPQDPAAPPARGATVWLAAPGEAERIRRVEATLPHVPVSAGDPIALDVEGWMRAYRVPGISVAVFDDFRVVWAKAYGVREAGRPAPVTLDTLFQAGSISKPVAAMAALHHVERGRFSLDEDINAALVSWKVPENEFTRTEKVTLRRLLSHSAGLTVHGFPGYAVTDPVPSTVQVLDGAAPANTAPVRVDLVPGTTFRYSGGGTTVVQLALVDQLGAPFPKIVDDTVLAPLGLADSTYEQPLPPARAARAASGHRRNGKVVDGRWHVYPEMAAAGLWTTPWDLAQVAIEVARSKAGRSNRVLAQDTVRLMLTPQAGEAGLGFFVDASGATDRFGHGGADEGFQAVLTAFAATGRGVVIMTNSDNGMPSVQPLLDAIAREYQWPGHRPWVPGVVDTVWLVTQTKGLDAGLAEYRRMRSARPATDFRPAQLNTFGYQLLADGRVEDAVAVFQRNVELYPADANAYDSLAEAHMTAGRTAQAIANYRKSLELDPKNENAVSALRKLGAGPPAARGAGAGDWIPLFDGRSLEGWVPKITGYDAGVNVGDTFRVENGVLKVAYDRYDGFGNRFGHLFHETPYSHYVLAIEYRFVGDQAKDGPAWAFRNSGVMIHGQPVGTMGKDQDFPVSIEVQFLGGRGDGTPRTTANLCTPGTHVVMNGALETRHCVNSTSGTYDGDQWVRVEVEVHGAGTITHRVNGEVVLTYAQPQVGGGGVAGHDPAATADGRLLEGGSISLQSESHPIEFRKVELLNLAGCTDPRATNYRAYFEKPDPSACRY
jgi:CubicO group peptidase (beta-lactamase class C family)